MWVKGDHGCDFNPLADYMRKLKKFIKGKIHEFLPSIFTSLNV